MLQSHESAVTVLRRAIELFRLHPSDWERFGTRVVSFEREHFPAGLREDPSELRRLIQSPTSIVIGVRTDAIPLAGYIGSDALEQFGDVPGVRADAHWSCNDTHYIAAVVVVPELRHQGIATLLVKDCVRAAQALGFTRVTAHMAEGAAAKLDTRIRVLDCYTDWYGTGQAFEYIEIPLEIAS